MQILNSPKWKNVKACAHLVWSPWFSLQPVDTDTGASPFCKIPVLITSTLNFIKATKRDIRLHSAVTNPELICILTKLIVTGTKIQVRCRSINECTCYDGIQPG